MFKLSNMIKPIYVTLMSNFITMSLGNSLFSIKDVLSYMIDPIPN